MKKVQILSGICAGLLTCSIIFVACQKAGVSTNTTVTAQDVVMLQASAAADDATDNVFNDVFANIMGSSADAGLGGGIGVFLKAPHNGPANNQPGSDQFTEGSDSAYCFYVTIDSAAPNSFPKTITIDFGTGCTGRDGHTRRGKIVAVFTGRMKESGSSVSASFDGFYIDTVSVEGTLTVQNNSTSNHRIFTVTVVNGKLSAPSGGFVEINRTHTYTQVEGNGTPDFPGDDIFNITGSSSGTAQLALITVQWTTEITDPLVRKFTCQWNVSGKEKLTFNDKTATLDYGNGDCDNKATITAGGNVYDITLH